MARNGIDVAELGMLGLAERLGKTNSVKNRVSRDGVLLLWTSDETIGIPSLAAASLNPDSLKCFIDIWCPRNPVGSLPNARVGPSLGLVEAEVHTF